jgi:hypothetical protein
LAGRGNVEKATESDRPGCNAACTRHSDGYFEQRNGLRCKIAHHPLSHRLRKHPDDSRYKGKDGRGARHQFAVAIETGCAVYDR